MTHIAVFLRVVDTGSFTAAARQLGMSKPTVSKHIATLEHYLGARLLNRTTRSLGLTEIGANFYTHCQKIMAELEAAESEVFEYSDTPRGRLRIVVPTGLGDRCVAEHLGGFLELYPEIEIDLTLDSRCVDLIKEGFDLAVRITRDEPSGIGAERLARCQHLVCGSPGYLERYGRPAKPDDLQQHNCLTYSDDRSGEGWRLEGPQGLETVKVAGRIRANDGDALRTALLSGVGLGLMPTYLVGQDLSAGRLCDALPDYRENSYGIVAIFPEAARVCPKVRAFVDYLSAHLDLDTAARRHDGVEVVGG